MADASDRPATLREEGDGRGWWAVVGRLAAALLVLGLIYVGAAFYFKDRPPSGVSVAGVDIGSLTDQEARAELGREFEDRTTEPIVVELVPEGDGGAGSEAEPVEVELVPEDAGLSLDLDRTLRGVTGLSFNPARMWDHVAGADEDLPLYGAVDPAALEATLSRLAEDYDTTPVEGEVSLSEDGVQVVDAQDGRTLEVGASADAVSEAWTEQVWDDRSATEGERRVAGVASGQRPQLTAEEVERFTEEVVTPALDAPVVVQAGRGRGEGRERAEAQLARRDLLQLLRVEQEDGSLSLGVREKATLARIRQDLGRLERGPRDATVRLEGSSVQVVGAQVGYALREDGLVDAVRAALPERGDGRTVEAEVETIEPQIPTSVSENWSFTQMASFSSQFPTGESNAARTANLRAGVTNVNGTVVMPGEQFSLGAALGAIEEANGYVEAPVIVDGRLVMGLGGGLSQISTVVFNVSWFAGVQLDAHTTHSFYISRYPAGREATLAVPVIDNLWTNDTSTPIVVQSWISGDEIQMVFLGDRQYAVETIDGPRRNTTTGERREDDRADCVPQSPADGFTIRNIRILRQGGEEVGRDDFTTTYDAADEIICTNPRAGS
ncbi:VanW family protein [Serinicoccus kebangsaanensis]|uniref:VanW family protein n=1 Tax=Serinicoccus kebangsaanensis TaxID=2602069 RepID=UPI00124DE79A|nr:VanW family protein [Serinicoccus kebangsaanensis]